MSSWELRGTVRRKRNRSNSEHFLKRLGFLFLLRLGLENGRARGGDRVVRRRVRAHVAHRQLNAVVFYTSGTAQGFARYRHAGARV